MEPVQIATSRALSNPVDAKVILWMLGFVSGVAASLMAIAVALF